MGVPDYGRSPRQGEPECYNSTMTKETVMDKIRYDYRHPVFYSRKHPFYAEKLDKEVRGALVAALAPTSPPF